MALMEPDHIGLLVTKCGFVIHPHYPHMGSSPDGMVSCLCCGKGVLEIKCLFSCVNKTLLEATKDSNF